MIPFHSVTAPFGLSGVPDWEEEVGEPLEATKEEITPDQEENRS